MNITPDHITALKPNEIFVYGSNEKYIHGAGASKMALKWGARYGEGPFCGHTYGISTKDKRIQTLSLDKIAQHVDDFTVFSQINPHYQFLVTQIGCGLAFWTPKEIAPLFKKASKLRNVWLPKSFWAELEEEK